MSYKINETTIYTVKEVAELLNVSDQSLMAGIQIAVELGWITT